MRKGTGQRSWSWKGIFGPQSLFSFRLLPSHLEGSSFSLLNSLLHDVLPGPKPKDTELNGLKLLKPGPLIWFSQALSH